ncbi:MAG: hypothetical protein WCW44_06560 [archaeon]|jgi:hypothetical protein
MITKEVFEEALFGKDDVCVVNFSYDSESGNLFDFAVVYLSKKESGALEIIRFDSSQKEAFHIHKFFASGKKEKQYIQMELDFNTVEWCIAELREKWFKYKIAFFDG